MPKPTPRRPVSSARPSVARPAAGPAARAVQRLAGDAVAAKDAKAKRARELLDRIAARKARIATEFYEMGRELAELSDGEYHSALDYPSFAAMIEDHGLLSRSVAWRLIAIYRSLPRNTALQLGPQKSTDWLLLLRSVAGPEATERELAAAARKPAVVQGTPVADLTTRELVELRRRAEARRAVARKDPAAADAHKLARTLAQLLRRRGAADADVAARYGRAWRIRVDLGLDAARTLNGLLEMK